MPDDIETIFIAMAFVVPGFVLHSTLSVFQTRKILTSDLYILRFLTLSAVNYAAWSWLIYLVIFGGFFQSSVLWSSIAWLWIILVGPILIGVVGAIANQKNWLGKLLNRFGLKPIHVTPSSWDWRFGTMIRPHWILVTMKDGSSVAGWFGSGSFASSDPAERDLYIEQVFEIGESGTWTIGPKSKGILLSGSEVKYAEIWPVEEGAA